MCDQQIAGARRARCLGRLLRSGVTVTVCLIDKLLSVGCLMNQPVDSSRKRGSVRTRSRVEAISYRSARTRRAQHFRRLNHSSIGKADRVSSLQPAKEWARRNAQFAGAFDIETPRPRPLCDAITQGEDSMVKRSRDNRESRRSVDLGLFAITKRLYADLGDLNRIVTEEDAQPPEGIEVFADAGGTYKSQRGLPPFERH